MGRGKRALASGGSPAAVTQRRGNRAGAGRHRSLSANVAKTSSAQRIELLRAGARGVLADNEQLRAAQQTTEPAAEHLLAPADALKRLTDTQLATVGSYHERVSVEDSLLALGAWDRDALQGRWAKQIAQYGEQEAPAKLRRLSEAKLLDETTRDRLLAAGDKGFWTALHGEDATWPLAFALDRSLRTDGLLNDPMLADDLAAQRLRASAQRVRQATVKLLARADGAEKLPSARHALHANTRLLACAESLRDTQLGDARARLQETLTGSTERAYLVSEQWAEHLRQLGDTHPYHHDRVGDLVVCAPALVKQLADGETPAALTQALTGSAEATAGPASAPAVTATTTPAAAPVRPVAAQLKPTPASEPLSHEQRLAQDPTYAAAFAAALERQRAARGLATPVAAAA